MLMEVRGLIPGNYPEFQEIFFEVEQMFTIFFRGLTALTSAELFFKNTKMATTRDMSRITSNKFSQSATEPKMVAISSGSIGGQ